MAIWIVKAKKKTDNPITAEAVCGFALFPECPLQGDHYTWSLDLDFAGPKPPLLEETPRPVCIIIIGSFIISIFTIFKDDAPTLKVLHLTDVHVDPHYTPGSNAECDEPVCCRKGQGDPKEEKDLAGYWGDYRDCDSPMHAFKDLIKHAAHQHPVWKNDAGKNYLGREIHILCAITICCL